MPRCRCVVACFVYFRLPSYRSMPADRLRGHMHQTNQAKPTQVTQTEPPSFVLTLTLAKRVSSKHRATLRPLPIHGRFFMQHGIRRGKTSSGGAIAGGCPRLPATLQVCGWRMHVLFCEQRYGVTAGRINDPIGLQHGLLVRKGSRRMVS